MKTLAFISNLATSLINFRGPLIKTIHQQGVKVYALAPDYDDQTRAAVRALGGIPVDFSMSRTGMNPLRDVGDIVNLALLLRRLRVDATFSYYIKPVIYGLLAARVAGVKQRFAMIEGAGYAFTDDEELSWRRKLLRNLVTRMYRTSLRFAHLVFMLNPDDKQLFVGQKMVAPEKVHLLNGIGLPLEHYLEVPPAVEPLTFLLIGRLLKEKGVYDFVEAARIFKRKGARANFIILGDVDVNPGSIRPEEVAEWVKEGIVEWPGHVPDIRPWVAKSSVFVLPSYREGLPRSTQELMAMSRPVITTDVPGCRETVVDGINGFKVPVRSPSALADAMMRFADNPELISSMGKASREIAVEKFDVVKVNATILAAIGLQGEPAKIKSGETVLMVASFADSLIKFRGELLLSLIRRGAEVHIAVPNLQQAPEIRSQLSVMGCICHETQMARNGTNPVSDTWTLLSLIGLMRKVRPTHVLAYTIKPVIYGMLAAKISGVPNRTALISGLGHAFATRAKGFSLLRLVQECLYRISLAYATRVVFQNPDDKQYFVENSLVKLSRTALVNGSGVPLQEFTQQLLPPVEKIHFLLVARLMRDKGIYEYIEAAREVRKAYPNAVFNLVGWIDSNPSSIAQHELQQWQDEGLIEFHGRLADVRSALASCHVFVLPSYREGTPRSVLEAMATGRAIITTDAPGCRETVRHGVNGLLVPVADAPALAAAMVQLLGDTAEIQRMGQRSRDIAERKYDVKFVNIEMLANMGLEP